MTWLSQGIDPYLGFWIAFFVSAVLALPIRNVLIGLKSRQTVSEFVPEHAQKQGTPTMGGLIVVAGVLAALGFFMARGEAHAVWPLLPLIIGFAAIGFLDDFVVPRRFANKRGLGWKQKLILEFAVAAAVVAFAPATTLWQKAIWALLIVSYSNAYNFVDGMDGLAGGVALFFLPGLAYLGWTANVGGPLWLSAILTGALVPFLFLNAPPAKLFMGDVGSLPIGASIGSMVASIVFRENAGGNFNVVIALLVLSGVMIAELVPVPLQIASVKLRKKRLFLMTPIHHAFQKKGVPETRVVWGFILVQLLLTAIVITLATEYVPRFGAMR